MDISKFKYRTTFAHQIKVLVSDEKDKFLSLASSELLKDLIPDNLKGEKNIDLLPICGPLANVNRANLNNDLIDEETALNIYKQFILRPLDLNHNRSKIIGCITNTGFSEFLTDKPLTEKEAKDKKVFNISISGVVYKIVSDQLVKFLEESSDPKSETYGQAQLSWELAFSNFKILLGSKYISEGKVLSDEKDISEYEKFLPSNGGTGKDKDGNEVYRLICGEVFPLGAAITSSPAAKLNQIFVLNDEDNEKEKKSSNSNNINNLNKISQSNKDNVNKNKTIQKTNMKIKNITDITDENLKEISASTITNFIDSQIEEANKEWLKKVNQEKELVKTTEQKFESLSQEAKQSKEELEKVKKDLEKLQSEASERAQLELFNQRMAHFDEVYDLTDEDRLVIKDQLKDLDEKGFKNLEASFKTLMKEKNKEFKKAKTKKAKEDAEAELSAKAEQETKDKEKKDLEAKASIDKALDNSDKKDKGLPNSTDSTNVSFKDKYKEAFSMENCLDLGKKK